MFFSFSSVDIANVSSISAQLSSQSIDIAASLSPSQSQAASGTLDTGIIINTFESIASQNPYSSLSILNCSALTDVSVDVSQCLLQGVFVADVTVITELPHFQLFFGNNAKQTANTLTISKSDLTGLTPSSTNTAQSILVAILNRILANINAVQFLHIDFNYRGYGLTEGKRIDTVSITLYDALPMTSVFEIGQISTTVNPNVY